MPWIEQPHAEITATDRIDHDGLFECDSCGQRWRDVSRFTLDCPRCGALYNGFGQRLADPSLWGDETGESPADVRRIG